MQNSRKVATIKNIIAALIYQLVAIVFGFIIPRLFLTIYTPEIHGLTSAITNIMSYVMLLYAGLNTASIQALYVPVGKKDYNKINEVLNAIKKYYINTGVAFIIAVLLLASILPFYIKNVSGSTVFFLMLVMGLQSSLTSFLLSANNVLLQADQKLYILTLFNIITLVIRGLIQVYLINSFASPILVQFVPTVMVILTMIMQKVYINKHYPRLDSRVKPDYKSLSKRWAALVHQISGLIVNNTDIMLLTIITGDMKLVSIYSVYQLVFANLYNLMTTVFSQGSVASFGNLMATDSITVLRKNYNIYEYIYYSFISVVYSVTAVLILPFVNLYTKGVPDITYADKKLAILFLTVGVINNLRVPGGTIINAGGYFKETQWRAILEASINLLFSLILVKSLGLYGLLIGTIASFSYRTTDIIIFSNKYILRTKAKFTFLRSLRVILVILISVVTFNYFIKLNILSWSKWFTTAIIVGLFSLFLTLMLNFIFEKKLSSELENILIKAVNKYF